MSTRRLTQSLITAVAVAVTALVAVPASSEPASRQSDPSVVRVDSGWLRGNVTEDHVTYTGIPYAAPPVGERRWRPPNRPKPWSGVRDATTASPLCPQHDGEAAIGQEDCLYLDVTVPRSAQRGNRLPVFVWLHGGGFTSGGAQRFDGTELASAGDMIVVTINYRLGALGFLSTPEVDASGGNYGLMDQAAAMRWVQRNAARFGGDNRNVTLAGQSGGARSVCAHLAAPSSRGLFDRAISQSGACDNRVPTRSEAREFGAQAIEYLGCTSAADVATCMRRQSPAQLVKTLAGVGLDLSNRVNDRPWNPVAGTRYLPRQPADALHNGTAARVPFLVGANRDEMNGFVAGRVPNLTADEYRVKLTETFGDASGDVLAEYPLADYESPALALATVISDWGGAIGACPVLRTADAAAAHQPVYAYEFAEDSGQAFPGLPWGAYHGLELPYLWTLNGQSPYPELTPEQEQLSATMVEYWAAFARTGDPNGAGRPQWPEFGSNDSVIRLSTDRIVPTPFADDHRCDFWEGRPRDSRVMNGGPK
jgi:para-nitrobenzyl esterase